MQRLGTWSASCWDCSRRWFRKTSLRDLTPVFITWHDMMRYVAIWKTVAYVWRGGGQHVLSCLNKMLWIDSMFICKGVIFCVTLYELWRGSLFVWHGSVGKTHHFHVVSGIRCVENVAWSFGLAPHGTYVTFCCTRRPWWRCLMGMGVRQLICNWLRVIWIAISQLFGFVRRCCDSWRQRMYILWDVLILFARTMLCSGQTRSQCTDSGLGLHSSGGFCWSNEVHSRNHLEPPRKPVLDSSVWGRSLQDLSGRVFACHCGRASQRPQLEWWRWWHVHRKLHDNVVLSFDIRSCQQGKLRFLSSLLRGTQWGDGEVRWCPWLCSTGQAISCWSSLRCWESEAGSVSFIAPCNGL